MGLRPDESREMNIRHNREMDRLAREYDVPLHTHAYGGDVQFLYDTTPEVLTPRLSLVHSTGYSDRELEILAETGAYVFHGPTTHSNITGHCRVMEMLEQGVNLAVVTDGTASDRSYDLWRDMKNIQLLQRYRYKDGSLLPADGCWSSAPSNRPGHWEWIISSVRWSRARRQTSLRLM